MVYVGTCDHYENIKTTLIYNWHIKTMTPEIFNYKNEMIAKFNYIL